MILDRYLIREATYEDCRRIIDELWKPFLNVCCEYEFSLDPEVEDLFFNHLQGIIKDDNSTIYVAEVTPHLVGYVTGTIRRNSPVYETKEIGEITDLYVKPEYRNQSIGKGLVESVEKWFCERGIDIIWLRTHFQNRRCNSFWEELGYNIFAIERIKQLR